VAKGLIATHIESTEYNFDVYRPHKQLLNIFDFLSKNGMVKLNNNMLTTEKSP
jgi:hypothetical protein